MVEHIIIAILIAVIIVMAIVWPKTIVLSDWAPEELSDKNKWLKLQNEGGKYVKIKDNKIWIKIVK